MMWKVFIVSIITAIGLSAGNLVIKKSHSSVDVTVTKMEQIIKQKGITLFNVIDFQAGAKSVGLKMNEAKLLIFGNPKLGTRIMQRDITAAIDLPMKVLVYKNSEGQTIIEYKDPKNLEKSYQLEDCVVLPKLSGALDKITSKAAM